VLHRWLAAALQQHPVPQEAGVARLTDLLQQTAPEFLFDCTPLECALWLPKMRKLAPAVAAAWVASGARWQVETALSTQWHGVQIVAQADALATNAQGVQILDYKTGTPPSAAEVRRGEKPQLALEGWLLQQQGETLSSLAYWHLKGFGETPLPVVELAPDETVLGPVEPTLTAVQETYFQAGATWPAVPDAVGAGVVATGPCEHCSLAGVCRRSAWAQQGLVEGLGT
jgi:hypothetical protein